jgi:hypothetical protein
MGVSDDPVLYLFRFFDTPPDNSHGMVIFQLAVTIIDTVLISIGNQGIRKVHVSSGGALRKSKLRILNLLDNKDLSGNLTSSAIELAATRDIGIRITKLAHLATSRLNVL